MPYTLVILTALFLLAIALAWFFPAPSADAELSPLVEEIQENTPAQPSITRTRKSARRTPSFARDTAAAAADTTRTPVA
jgi:hypothetical protein